jgi:hypothetical protein
LASSVAVQSAVVATFLVRGAVTGLLVISEGTHGLEQTIGL